MSFVDDFHPIPKQERARALAADYQDTEHNGLVYPGISLAPDPESENRIREMLGLRGGEFTTFYRRYLPTERPVTCIHNDSQIGALSAILFLTPPEQCRGGLAFWRHRLYRWEGQPAHSSEATRQYGIEDTKAFWESIHQDGFDERRWEMIDYVPMEFNRLVLFRSGAYHSRYPFDPIGDTPDTCRLIKTFFWRPDAETLSAPQAETSAPGGLEAPPGAGLAVRPFELGRDYPDICEWWRARKWKALPVSSLPNQGIVVEGPDGEKAAAIFWYLCEGEWAWVDYLVTNPDALLRTRPKAIELAVTTALRMIQEVKQRVGLRARIITVLDNENLIGIFSRLGFRRGDGKMTTMIWGGG